MMMLADNPSVAPSLLLLSCQSHMAIWALHSPNYTHFLASWWRLFWLAHVHSAQKEKWSFKRLLICTRFPSPHFSFCRLPSITPSCLSSPPPPYIPAATSHFLNFLSTLDNQQCGYEEWNDYITKEMWSLIIDIFWHADMSAWFVW